MKSRKDDIIILDSDDPVENEITNVEKIHGLGEDSSSSTEKSTSIDDMTPEQMKDALRKLLKTK